MAVFHSHTVKCACGNSLVVQLADSINVKRAPDVRDRILRGELHRAACPTCGRQMTVEKPFYYTDLTRHALFKVYPRGERHLWVEASRELDAASGFITDEVSDSKKRTLRVLFGMDELREKLVAQDAMLDDRVLELLKVLLVYEHPILLRRPRLRLLLQHSSDDRLEFGASYEHDPRRFRLSMPKRVVDELHSAPEKLQVWADRAHQASIFKLPDHWVSFWRWSPQPTALNRLKGYAAELRAGHPIDTGAQAFRRMLAGLPRGTHLPPWAKQDLRTLYEYAKAQKLNQLEDELFEIRFGVELEDDWSSNGDADDIDTLWQLLKNLPDTNVEGNTKLHELVLDEGTGGGLYDPTSHDISIGSLELSHRERFEDVVRHEVGHAVHEMSSAVVDHWLTKRFGWQIFGRNDDDIDQWVGLMGGWSDLTSAQRRDVRDALRTALGNGDCWSPGPTPSLPPGHPWHKASFGPRLAFEKTGSNWYEKYKSWHRAGGKAFFLNYWYQTFIAVDEATLELVAAMPDNYAAMSHYEFFAELYALHYDLDDPKRSDIPHDVAEWLNTKIGASAVGAPMPAARGPKREWETVGRPSRPNSP